MPTYRLFKLDHAGKYAAGEEMDASDDDAIMVEASAAGHAHGCEVWLARRLVGRVVARQG